MGAEFTLVGASASNNAALYEAPWQADQYWSGYLLPSASAPPPDTISYADSLTSNRISGVWVPLYAGWYLLAPTRPANLDTDPGAFIDTVTAYVAKQNLDAGSQVILWIPAVSPVVTYGTPFADYSIVFTCRASGGTFAATSNLNAALGQDELGEGLTFNLLANTYLSIDTDNGALKFSVTASYKKGIGFELGHEDLGITLLGDGSTIYANLPFTGVNAGCFLFLAEIQSSVTFGQDRLPVGFFYTATETNETGTPTDSFYFPAFAAPALPATLSCMGSVDVLDPFNQKMPPAVLASGVVRTGFALPAGAALKSCFSDLQGNVISLTPMAGTTTQSMQLGLQAGALAFTTNAVVPSDPTTAMPGLTLTGLFGVTAAKSVSGQPIELLCGIFGSERIALTSYDATALDNDLLLFGLGQAAYAPIFPFPTANLNQPDSGAVSPRLTNQRTTAWATVVQGTTTVPSYSAEPAGSPMFGFPTTVGTGAIILESQPPSLPVPQGLAHAFPLVPYAGLTSADLAGSTLASFESTILATTRKQIISAGATATWAARANTSARAAQARLDRHAGLVVTDDPALVYRATPQGMIATVEPDTGSYHSVTLGQTVQGDGTVLPFGFLLPTTTLQDGLQTNQLFLVVVNPSNLVSQASDFENVLEIAGWRMKADVGTGVSATAYANVMVMKYCSGTFAERITNPNQWSSQDDFSLPAGVDKDSPQAGVCYTGLSTWLQDLVAKAQTAVTNNPKSPYSNFIEIVNDPDWNGVMVLEATLDASSLPSGLAGIAAGIDMTQFKAHHFGFTASRLSTNSDSTITFNGNSRTFGLVDYANPVFAANLAMNMSPDTPIILSGNSNYDFCVLQLQSLFENSAIALFKSYIELAANNILSTEVIATTFGGNVMPTNAVVLDGSYIDQGGTGVYVFVQSTPTVFTLDSNILRAVTFDRVQFNCLGTIDDGATMLNRFQIWGRFDFAALIDTSGAPLDILSFGDLGDGTATPSGLGLSFSNLLIDMTYPETTPSAVTFTENTKSLSYDLANSNYRADSLFLGFSLELSGFIAATAGQSPPDFGFLTVSAPLDLTPLGDTWYGITYNVTMGGPGALASAAGFSSSLLLAWSPASSATDKAYSMFTGLSLPGAAPGAKLISLQGVFKVAVDSIALSRQLVPDGSGDYYYCLQLENIGVKIFGIAKLPPDGNINFFLFGDPGSTSGLGWYAAYVRSPAAAAAPALLEQ
jgi:hypothetical protein